MTEHEVDHEMLADAIIRKLKENHHTLWLDPEAHSAQHEFIRMLIMEREEKIARQKRIQDKIAGSLILSTILGLITLIGAGAVGWLQGHIK